MRLLIDRLNTDCIKTKTRASITQHKTTHAHTHGSTYIQYIGNFCGIVNTMTDYLLLALNNYHIYIHVALGAGNQSTGELLTSSAAQKQCAIELWQEGRLRWK